MALRRTFPAPGGSALPIIDTQLDFAGLIARDASGAVRSGVLPSHTGPLATARSDLAVDVAAFPVVLVRNGRMILAANDGATRVAVGQPPTANRVIKVIGVRQADPSGTGASPDPEWVLTVGAASDTPDEAAVIAASRAAGAEPIIAVEMPAGSYTVTTASGVIIRTICRYTAAAGGVVPVRTKAEADTLALADGGTVYLLDRKSLLVRSGTAWVPSGGVLPFGELGTAAQAGLPGGSWITLGAAAPNPASALSDVEWAGSSRSGGLIARTRGRYLVAANAAFDATDDGRQRFVVNGNGFFGEEGVKGAGGIARTNVSTVVTLNVGDVVETQMLTNTGGQLYGNRYTLNWIGAAP